MGCCNARKFYWHSLERGYLVRASGRDKQPAAESDATVAKVRAPLAALWRAPFPPAATEPCHSSLLIGEAIFLSTVLINPTAFMCSRNPWMVSLLNYMPTYNLILHACLRKARTGALFRDSRARAWPLLRGAQISESGSAWKPRPLYCAHRARFPSPSGRLSRAKFHLFTHKYTPLSNIFKCAARTWPW